MLAQVQLLFTVVFAEMALIVLLLFKTPFRKLEIMALDRLKRGRGPLVVKSVGATVLVLMVYTVYSIRDLQSRAADSLNPTDQVLLSHQILQASLMGFSLFLSLMIDRLHHYIRELRLLRKTMEAAKKQNRSAEDLKRSGSEEMKGLGEEVAALRANVEMLQSKCKSKEEELKAASTHSAAHKSQSESLLLEYDHLLEENQNLRSQLQSIEHSVSHSDGKKNT